MQFRGKIVQLILFTLTSTFLGVIFAVFLNRVFHRHAALTYQKTIFENPSTNQEPELTQSKVSETYQHSQTKKDENLKFDRSTSEMAHTAQLTLISILLGAILAALFIGLPNGFAINIWSKSNVDLDLRVLATFLVAVDLWIKYSWAVIVVRWPFNLLHNFTYFLFSGTVMGLALSVDNYYAWFSWGGVTCFVTLLVYVFTLYTVLKENKISHHRVVIAEDPPYTKKELDLLLKSSVAAGLMIFLATIILLYGTLNFYQILPIWARWNFSPTFIGGLATAFVFMDLLIHGMVFMPQQKYGNIPSPDRLYRH